MSSAFFSQLKRAIFRANSAAGEGGLFFLRGVVRGFLLAGDFGVFTPQLN